MSESFSTPLDGPLERAGFSPGLTIVVALIVGFLMFQGVSLLVVLGLVVIQGGLDVSLASDIPAFVEQYAAQLLGANTVGQVVGLLLLGWGLARLHSSRPSRFLRLQGVRWPMMLLSIVGMLALIPIVQWVGTGMDALPWPESIRAFEQTQIELLERVLEGDFSIAFALGTMAVTPAICEEVFFRGYLQRQAERAFPGWVVPVVLIGVLFGLYHLRPTQAVPLSMLGIYLAYVTWLSGSLWPAMAGHFLNNGLAVSVAAFMSSRPDLSSTDLESLAMPMYILVPAGLIFILVVGTMHRLGADEAGRPDALN